MLISYPTLEIRLNSDLKQIFESINEKVRMQREFHYLVKIMPTGCLWEPQLQSEKLLETTTVNSLREKWCQNTIKWEWLEKDLFRLPNQVWEQPSILKNLKLQQSTLLVEVRGIRKRLNLCEGDKICLKWRNLRMSSQELTPTWNLTSKQ